MWNESVLPGVVFCKPGYEGIILSYSSNYDKFARHRCRRRRTEDSRLEELRRLYLQTFAYEILLK